MHAISSAEWRCRQCCAARRCFAWHHPTHSQGLRPFSPGCQGRLPAMHQPAARTLFIPCNDWRHASCLLGAVSCSAGRALASREAAYNHELRRGQRAPDALAAALAKRAFVRKVPYLVSTAALPRPIGQLEGSWGPPFIPLENGDSIRQVYSAGPSIAEQLEERQEAGRGAKQGLCTAKAGFLLRKQGKTGLSARQLPRVHCHDPRQPSTHYLAAARAGKACSGPQGQQGDSTTAEQRPVQSLAERFADMQRTVMERLTCGALFSSRCASLKNDA